MMRSGAALAKSALTCIRSHHQPFVLHAARIPHAIKGDIQMLAGTFTNPMLDVYEQCASNVKKLVGEVSRSD